MLRKIDIEQELLRKRELFIFRDICSGSALNIIEEIKTLDNISNKPITIWINSGGGSVNDGYAIIDAMRMARSPIATIITGEACSMGGIISVAGDVRLMTENSVWMAHDLAGGVWGDYTTKVIDRVKYLAGEQKRGETILRSFTKLSEAELKQSRHGELWLFPDDCLEKGIVDSVIRLNGQVSISKDVQKATKKKKKRRTK